jgi:hypothetical protein
MSAKTYVEKRIEEIQRELDELKNSVSLPKGFVAFNPTKEDKCPCHPNDKVLVKYRCGITTTHPKLAGDWQWNDKKNDYDVIAYKIVEKHIGPRPMKLAGVPVGVPFAAKTEKPESVWIKTNDGTFIMIYNNAKNPFVGYVFLLDDRVDYYEVKIKVGG